MPTTPTLLTQITVPFPRIWPSALWSTQLPKLVHDDMSRFIGTTLPVSAEPTIFLHRHIRSWLRFIARGGESSFSVL